MEIVDAHTHFFSWTFFETLARQAQPGADPAEVITHLARRTGLEVPDRDPDAHRARWVEEMDRHGVQRMVTFASLPEEAEVVSQAAAGSGGRLVPFGVVNPRAPESPALAGRMLREWGYRGLIFFPAMHHYRIDDDVCRPLLTLGVEHRALAVVHCGVLEVKLRDLLGLPRISDARYADPLACVPVANALPDLRLIIPHFGGGFFRETLMAGAQCKNLYVDTSSSNAWMQWQENSTRLADVFRKTVAVFGAERILFGTDSSVFPRGWRKPLLDAQREAMTEAGIADADQAQILCGNALRLLDGE